ncbi:response regulator transcription factor [Chitinivorax sp. PXF-14]|uniref:response regulator n=1 Tax=Chitinivorax sp. PXF-14 TaxID=3230488 RepID=UPI003465CF8F
MASQLAAADSTAPMRVAVLLVEDSPLLREALTACFAHRPDIVFSAHASGAEAAVEQLRSHRFDLAVVDLELQQGTGFDVLAYLASLDPAQRALPLVLTNHAFPLYRRHALALGAAYFFDKSMQFDEAIAAIEAEAQRVLEQGSG